MDTLYNYEADLQRYADEAYYYERFIDLKR